MCYNIVFGNIVVGFLPLISTEWSPRVLRTFLPVKVTEPCNGARGNIHTVRLNRGGNITISLGNWLFSWGSGAFFEKEVLILNHLSVRLGFNSESSKRAWARRSSRQWVSRGLSVPHATIGLALRTPGGHTAHWLGVQDLEATGTWIPPLLCSWWGT